MRREFYQSIIVLIAVAGAVILALAVIASMARSEHVLWAEDNLYPCGERSLDWRQERLVIRDKRIFIERKSRVANFSPSRPPLAAARSNMIWHTGSEAYNSARLPANFDFGGIQYRSGVFHRESYRVDSLTELGVHATDFAIAGSLFILGSIWAARRRRARTRLGGFEIANKSTPPIDHRVNRTAPVR